MYLEITMERVKFTVELGHLKMPLSTSIALFIPYIWFLGLM